jgi:hypothetical protein
LATKELKIDQIPGQERPHATHFVAGVGKETVPFDPIVKLVGKAEQYLLALLMAQIFTLSKCLSSSVARYPQMLRTEWVVQKGTGAGASDCVDPAQIILLVASIDFVQQIEKAMAQCTGGDLRALNKSFDVIKTQLADLINMTQVTATALP